MFIYFIDTRISESVYLPTYFLYCTDNSKTRFNFLNCFASIFKCVLIFCRFQYHLPIYLFIKAVFIYIFAGPKALPESLVRVQKLTNKSLIFYPADLTKKDSLREVFSQVHTYISANLLK